MGSSDYQYPLIGEFNNLEASIGARGMGKTTWQLSRAWQIQHESGAYVIGHSLGARLTKQLPKELGGHKLPIKYHTTLDKLQRGLFWSPAKWHILAPPLALDGNQVKAGEALATADSLLQFSARFSTEIRRRAWKKKHPLRTWHPNVDMEGIRCPPVIVIIDEGIAIESAGISRKEDNRWFLQYLYSLRHYHIALLYAIQDGTARSWRVLEQATRIFVFAIRHEWALQAMNAAGATRDETDKIKRLKKYQHIEIAAFDVERLESDLNVDVKKLEESGGTAKLPGTDESTDKKTDNSDLG